MPYTVALSRRNTIRSPVIFNDLLSFVQLRGGGEDVERIGGDEKVLGATLKRRLIPSRFAQVYTGRRVRGIVVADIHSDDDGMSFESCVDNLRL